MLSTLTNINCEIKSMEVYSALFAISIQFSATIHEFSFSTRHWEFENQLNAAHMESQWHDIWTTMYDLYMTHVDIKLDLDYEDDEIHRAQNEINSERVEEYAFPSICSLELDSPV